MYKIKYSNGSKQLGWVVLLLLFVMVLPTLGLIWFMTAAIKNEHLAVRQKYIDFYRNKIKSQVSLLNENIWTKQNESILSAIRTDPDFSDGKFWLVNDILNRYIDAAVLYNKDGQLLWPLAEPADTIVESADNIFTTAWKYEFVDNDRQAALAEYRKVKDVTDDLRTVTKANLAITRLLSVSGQTDKAVALCLETACPETENPEELLSISDLIPQARVMLAEIYKNNKPGELTAYLTGVLGIIQHDSKVDLSKAPLSSESRVWMLDTLFSIYEEQTGREDRAKADDILRFESKSIDLLKTISTFDFDQWPQSTIRRINDEFYTYINTGDFRLVCNYDYHKIQDDLYTANIESLDDDTVYARLMDNFENDIFHIDSHRSPPLLSIPPCSYMPGWQLQVYLKDTAFFDSAAGRQSALYAWGGILLITIIITGGGVLSVSIGRQYRLNKLKNSFIATVTHELKTPLSSMRLLVDTLLEGNYNNRSQAREYLEMISRENIRLSRLIDNFLTFSRMERNKHSFEIEQADAANIARQAVEAVRNRFEQSAADFSSDIPEYLPPIAADSDAMVTVLVNLLDNSLKYTTDNKKISFSVFSDGSFVCFRIEDNGIGMSQRVQKKIFDRFYQADRHLSRISEGCGLGLSIVKFIVDAHGGRISVDSEINEGTAFTVKIPLTRKG